ncbi:MAG: DNA glycosylase AlkZ-like family protein [Lachnospiraceae bacterium]
MSGPRLLRAAARRHGGRAPAERRSVPSKEELDRVLARRRSRSSHRSSSRSGATARCTATRKAVGRRSRRILHAQALRFCGARGVRQAAGREPGIRLPSSGWAGGLRPRRTLRAGLVRKFLRCYAPATERELAAWLGSSPAQARRLWRAVEPELVPVLCGGKKKYALACQLEEFRGSEPGTSLAAARHRTTPISTRATGS